MEGDGSEALEPPDRPPDGEGMLGDGELRPPEPPELPEEPPEDPLEDGGEEDGEGIEVDCWLAQPPISSAETALTPAM